MKKLILFLCLSSLSAFASEPAFYSVPVSPNLEEFAIFEIEAPQIVKEGTNIQITYKMPEELVGEKFPLVTMVGTIARKDSFVLLGENVKAECVVVSEQTNCRMEFSDLELNKQDIAKVIREKSKNIKEERIRRKIAKVFSGDPVGVFSYSY